MFVESFQMYSLSSSRSCWGCQITDEGLFKISSAKCIGKLTSISLWGMAGITDSGVINLVRTSLAVIKILCSLSYRS
jgi:hypothetical protein